MSASLSANRRVMLTSGQTDNGRALNAHGARSIPWIRGGVHWGFHPAITVNDGTYETLFSRRVCSLHTSCKYSVTPDLMVNGADVRVTPVCKPTHPKPIRDAKREPSKIDAAPSKIRCHSSFSSKLYQILMFLHKRILSNFKIPMSLVSHPVLWLEGGRRDRNRRGVKFNYVIHRSWRLFLDPFGFDLSPSPKKKEISPRYPFAA